MAFGFLGDIVEGIGDVILPKGTRGATIGGFLGGPSGAALGASISSQLSSSAGKSAVSTPTVEQSPQAARESAGSGTMVNVFQPNYAEMMRSSSGIVSRQMPVPRPTIPQTVGEAAGGLIMDLIPDITISKFFGGSQVCATRPSGAPVTIKADGCITVSRKQQQRLKVMVQTIGLPAVADALGLSEGEVAALLLKNFPRRGKGISAAQLRNAKRVNRTIMGMAKQLQDACKSPVTRRRK